MTTSGKRIHQVIVAAYKFIHCNEQLLSKRQEGIGQASFGWEDTEQAASSGDGDSGQVLRNSIKPSIWGWNLLFEKKGTKVLKSGTCPVFWVGYLWGLKPDI